MLTDCYGTPTSRSTSSIRGGQLGAVGTSRPAGDPALPVAGVASGFFPWPFIGHRAFDGEHAAVVVGHDTIKGKRDRAVKSCHVQPVRVGASASSRTNGCH